VLGKAIALKFSRLWGDRSYTPILIKYAIAYSVKDKMGLVRLRIRELAAEKGWTLKEVAERSGVNYSTVASYTRREAMAMTDFTAIQKLARAFDIPIEDLVEVLEE
jgi:DNA-binding Xre family transcriptional regulator